jgi:hypothetical protein
MKKLYNPKSRMRTEIPEFDKRLQFRNHTLLGHRVAVIHENIRIIDTLLVLIEKYPLTVYRHVFEYKTRGIQRIKLCRDGYDLLCKQMDLKHKDIIDKLRIRKRQNKARLNLKKKGIF